MKFLVDAQLPPALAGWLREAGHEAQHVEEAGLHHAGDKILWQHALRHSAIIVTKDEDFAARATQDAGKAVVVVWLRLGNATNRALREWLLPRLPGIISLLSQGSRLVEVL